MALFKVAPNKRHLLNSQQQPFFVLGVNYAGYFDRAWKMWERDLFDPTLIERDFRKAQASGYNSVRLFVHTALERDIRQGDFDKLDQALSLAQDNSLRVMLALNDSHSVNLSRVADVDSKIAARYKDVPTIFSYDLQNEPVFYNLVAAMYPNGYPAAVQTSQLVDHYGERVSRAETLDMKNQRRIPVFLDDDTAYYYINALRLFLEYDAAVNTFVRRGGGTIVDFMLSSEAEPWHTFIGVMDSTLDTWLRARLDPIRATGCSHLTTVGWSWWHFSTLPANRLLDVQQIHNYADMTLAGFNSNRQQLQSMRQAFPGHPVLLGEFGWSNQSSENPATSKAVSAQLTGLYEAATQAYLRADGFAGAIKWMLNDLDAADNPREASFGVFAVGDQAKPIRDLTLRQSEDWPPLSQPATFAAVRDGADGMAYRADQPGQITVGGHFYQDSALTWAAAGDAGHCYLKLTGAEIIIEAHGGGQISLSPWQILPDWDKACETNLFRLFSDSHRTRQQTFAAGEDVVLQLAPGAQYAVAMGASLPGEPPATDLPLPSPNAGEHVVVLGDSDQYLQAAMVYIRRFSPDFTFAADDVAGKWAYVSVVATPQQVPDSVLEHIRSVGTLLVERVAADSAATTKALLDDMAARGQRFRGVSSPPPGEPPTEPLPPPPTRPPDETYIVKPGDTLGGIAKKVYGDFRLWPTIFEANRDKISSPSLIRVGMELLIPPKPAA